MKWGIIHASNISGLASGMSGCKPHVTVRGKEVYSSYQLNCY